MTAEKKNVALLCATQALLFTNNTILIAINGLAGYALAADKSLATLPVTFYVIGAALTILADGTAPWEDRPLQIAGLGQLPGVKGKADPAKH